MREAVYTCIDPLVTYNRLGNETRATLLCEKFVCSNKLIFTLSYSLMKNHKITTPKIVGCERPVDWTNTSIFFLQKLFLSLITDLSNLNGE